MSSRRMSLLPWVTLHSDSEQSFCSHLCQPSTNKHAMYISHVVYFQPHTKIVCTTTKKSMLKRYKYKNVGEK
jgi:hypothetical protein